MNIAALVIAIIGVLITISVAYLVDRKTRRILRRIDATIVADKSLEEFRQIERLVEDMEHIGNKRGRVVQLENGSYSIKWSQELNTSTKPSASLTAKKNKGRDNEKS